MRSVRIFGFLMIAAGTVILLAYLIRPVRDLWPWFRSLPIAVQIGSGAAGIGFMVLMGTLIWERVEDREADRELKDDM